MIDPSHPLSLTRQAKLLNFSRSGVYYKSHPVCEKDQTMMNRIDKLHPAHPFAGARMLRDMLRLEGFDAGRVHVSTLMRKMGVEALYRKPGTTLRHPAHRIYPCLLRDLNIYRPNQVWRWILPVFLWQKGLCT